MQQTNHQKKSNLLKMISERANLEEGEEGVRKILREVYRNRKIGTKELASLTQLPVPVIAAVRKELEKEKLLSRDGGAFLTKKGETYVEKKLGLIYKSVLTCPACRSRNIQISDNFAPTLHKLRTYSSLRPKPLPWLDQTHGTPETSLLRALFALEKGDVEGRKIIFLGDDDFTSIAVGMLKAAKEITVVDVDQRLLEAIKRISNLEDIPIKCVEWDLRKPLPQPLQYKYDSVFTDPPYTVAGLNLFVSRGISALQKRKGACIYLSFPQQPSQKMLNLQRALGTMGLAIAEQIPRFNVYKGAEMHANTTSLSRLETTEKTKPLITEIFKEKLYTGEITKTIRTYRCRCGAQINVGSTELLHTIEELKEEGCPECKEKKGFKLIKKLKLKETLAERLKLRKFEWSDFPEILDFEREISLRSFPDASILNEEYHRQKVKKAKEREPLGLKVALLDNNIVGWLWLKTEKDRNTNERFGYIKSIIVKPEHRHQGFGKKLVNTAKQYFLSEGIQRIDLIVSAANREASSFFEEIGFEREHCTMRISIKGEEKRIA